MTGALLVALASCCVFAGSARADKVEDAEAAFADYDDVTAVRLFTEALADSEGRPVVKAAALHGRGEVYASTQRYEQAIVDFTAALAAAEEAGQKAGILVSRAESYAVLERYDDALRDYEASLALAPKARANVYQKQGKTREALAAFEAELKIHPGFYRALSARAVILNLPLPRNPTEGR